MKRKIKCMFIPELLVNISFLGNTSLFSGMNTDCQCNQGYKYRMRKSKSSICAIHKIGLVIAFSCVLLF